MGGISLMVGINQVLSFRKALVRAGQPENNSSKLRGAGRSECWHSCEAWPDAFLLCWHSDVEGSKTRGTLPSKQAPFQPVEDVILEFGMCIIIVDVILFLANSVILTRG